tara:strand:- start:452 stop:604 length:153 start_codon:yes stop_codon:yes gene_type:complete
MSDYTGYIFATYSISAAALLVLAARSYMSLKKTEREVVALRQARKSMGDD